MNFESKVPEVQSKSISESDLSWVNDSDIDFKNLIDESNDIENTTNTMDLNIDDSLLVSIWNSQLMQDNNSACLNNDSYTQTNETKLLESIINEDLESIPDSPRSSHTESIGESILDTDSQQSEQSQKENKEVVNDIAEPQKPKVWVTISDTSYDNQGSEILAEKRKWFKFLAS